MRKLIIAVALVALTTAPCLAAKLEDSTNAQAQAGARAAAGGGAKEHAGGLVGRL